MNNIRVVSNIPAAERLISETVNDAALEIAEIIESTAKNLVPVKTGALRNSITAKKSLFKDGGAVVLAGGAGARHAHLIELGRKKAPAYPFLRPAGERTARRAKRIIEQKLKEKLG